jgi:sugar-specific transcriptional regulator TrmB
MSLETKLLSLGLTEKEVAVYMAMLYLGPSTAQEISIRASVNRATTYVMIDSLVDKGLASQIAKDKKTIFQAEDPIEILKVLEAERADVEDKMGQARMVIPELQELFNLNRSKVNVRLFEGKESIRIIQNDLLRSKTKEYDTITNWSQATDEWPIKEGDHRQEIFKKDFKTRALFTYNPSKPIPQFPFMKHEERRMLPQDTYPIHGEILLYGNKVSMISVSDDKIFGIVIEDAFLHKTFKTMFEVMWSASEKYKIK